MKSEKQRKHLQRLADLKRGKPSPLRGRILSEEHRKKIGKSKIAEKNPMWRADKVGYCALHDWIRRRLAKSILCNVCNRVPPYDLANISQEYKRDLSDWEWLCRSCHMKKDGRINNLKNQHA